jgi:hypothetical protein
MDEGFGLVVTTVVHSRVQNVSVVVVSCTLPWKTVN